MISVPRGCSRHWPSLSRREFPQVNGQKIVHVRRWLVVHCTAVVLQSIMYIVKYITYPRGVKCVLCRSQMCFVQNTVQGNNCGILQLLILHRHESTATHSTYTRYSRESHEVKPSISASKMEKIQVLSWASSILTTTRTTIYRVILRALLRQHADRIICAVAR